MRMPQFRIIWLMALVVFAALDFAAMRALSGSEKGLFLIIGSLPTANVMAVAFLFGRQRSHSHPFLLGFQTFGVIALILYAASVGYCSRPAGIMNSYFWLSIDRISKIFRGRPLVFVPINWFVALLMLAGPQLAFAVFGGFLSRRFKITVTPR